VVNAVRAAQKYAQEGKDWVVDIDITKFFDHVNHDILMGRIGSVIRDKRVLGLIGKYLRRGAMVEGIVTASEEGTPRPGQRVMAHLVCDTFASPLFSTSAAPPKTAVRTDRRAGASVTDLFIPATPVALLVRG